ncbi:MAG TPA: DNA recombination protein RmuC [Methylomirabilota bacterium]|nr:DNA recombination protein RmuC [Methylomirabilota bacterium]
MSTWIAAGAAAAVLFLLFWQLGQALQLRRREEETQNRMQQLQRDLQTLAGQAQAFSQQIGQMGQLVGQKMDSVTQALHKGVADSAQITAQAQAAMSGELRSSRDMLARVQLQLGEFQEAGRGMSQATQKLQEILGGAKSRGQLGEVTLERLLEDSLPSSQYSMQYRFSSGETADAVVLLRDAKRLAIDSKFPLDAYRRMAAEGDAARRDFATAIKSHVDAIAKKYIVPEEGTLDFALMFVPSENVYYELLVADSKGQPMPDYCRERRVIAVSPNTLYAYLCVIAMGLRGLQIEEDARRLYANLSGMQRQMEKFAEVFETLGSHLKNAQQTYGAADKQLDKAENILGNMLAPAGEQPDVAAESEPTLFPARSANSGS